MGLLVNLNDTPSGKTIQDAYVHIDHYEYFNDTARQTVRFHYKVFESEDLRFNRYGNQPMFGQIMEVPHPPEGEPVLPYLYDRIKQNDYVDQRARIDIRFSEARDHLVNRPKPIRDTHPDDLPGGMAHPDHPAHQEFLAQRQRRLEGSAPEVTP